MPTKMTIRELAELAENLRYVFLGDVVEAEYRKGSTTGKLSQIRFGRDEVRCRLTKKFIECLDNGTLTNYDKNYTFDITALIIDGKRTESPWARPKRRMRWLLE